MHRTAGRARVFLAAILPLFVLSAASASAGRVNFAKYQKVTASSQNSSYAPDLAADGIVSNFHSFRTGSTGPHWLEFAYPRQLTLASAHLYLGLNNIFNSSQVLGNFKFQYHDGSNWIDVPESAVTGNTQTEVNLIFSQAVTSDRFRLWTDNTGNRIIREIAMFPPNLVEGVEQGFPIGTDVRLNLAYKRPATASSASITNQYGPGYSKNAFDGYIDNKSRWVATASATGEWLEVDLLDNHSIGSAHVYTGYIDEAAPLPQTTQPMPDFKLQYLSLSGTDWIDIPGTTITGNTQVARVIPFEENVSTTRVRIVNTSNSNGKVQELLLFPPRTGGYELGREIIDAPPPTTKWDDYSDSSFKLRCGITDGRLLGFYDSAVRFSAGTLSRDALGWQLLLNYRDGSYRIRHNATGQCLALSQISFVDQNPVMLEDYTGLPHQDWYLQTVDATHFRIVNAYSGMALQTRYSNWTFGNPMAVRPVDGTDLQRWRTQDTIHHPKKGIAATENPAKPVPWGSGETWMQNSYPILGDKTSWSYSWGRQTSDTFPFMASNHTFNPMQWGDFNWLHGTTGPIDLLRRDIQSNPKPVHLMGFNEPEKTGQGVISVPDAIMRWPRLEAMEAPLVSPVPANTFSTWSDDFKNEANDRGYRRDYTAVHWYGPPDAGSLIDHLSQANTQFGRPVWLTEFSAVDWNENQNWTHADNFKFLAEFMWRAESLSWLKRYSLFQFAKAAPGDNQSAPDPASAPRSNARNQDGTLTAFGQLYAGWDGVTSVLNDKAYHLHNRGTYKRARNPVSTDTITSVDPDTPTTGIQWFLIPGTTANTVRICSTLDGRRLRYYTGTGGYVGLAAANNTQLQTEWRYVADQYGWYYIEHPNTNLRLGINGSGTLVMGAITSSGDSYKWRFVVPASSEPVSPPATPSPLSAQPSLTEIALTWPAVPGAASYTVHRSTTSGGPWQEMATGLAITSWTNSGLPYETQYFYTVTAVNALGGSSASSPASATTLHPFASYATWQQQKLGTFPPLGQTPDADAENDGQRNLLEFAFLTDPTLPNGNPFRVNGTSPGTITLEFPWNWRATSISWQLRHGSNLTNTAAWPVVAPGTTTITREGDIDRIRVTPSMAYPHRGFYVLEVIGN